MSSQRRSHCRKHLPARTRASNSPLATGFVRKSFGAGFHGRNEVFASRIVDDDQRVRTSALPVGIGDLQQPQGRAERGARVEDQHVGRVGGQQARQLVPSAMSAASDSRSLPSTVVSRRKAPRSLLTSKIVEVDAFITQLFPSRAPSKQGPKRRST